MAGNLPVAEGSEGPEVSDLQARLTRVDVGPITDPPGRFGPSTRAAVEAFQRQRGLRIDGIVGPSTFSTLVEAGLSLGDRLLYRAQPMLRGDDVAELQTRLCSLGFDTGRVDGIFGDDTARAVAEFQRNVQLPVDATAGRATVSELLRVSSRHQTLNLVTTVREREERRSAAPTLRGRHVAIGETGGLGTVAGALNRRLAEAGARVTLLTHPEESSQAAEANREQVDAFVSLRLDPDAIGCSVAFYSGYRYESTAGRMLAEQISTEVPKALGGGGTTAGMTLTVLRETQMPAVVIEVGPLDRVVERAPQLADAIAQAVINWAESRVESESD